MRNRCPRPIAMLLLLVAALASACAQADTFQQDDASLQIVATTSILADMVENVVADVAQVHPLLPQGADPHSYQVSASDARLLDQADIVFEHGAGLEQPLNAILNQAERAMRVDLSESEGITLLSTEGGPDPHVWFNPQNAQHYVDSILQVLATVDPANAERYSANSASYSAQLEELEQWIEQQVATIPPDKRLLVTNHDSLSYFANRYKFEIVGVIFPGNSTLNEPSAGTLAALSDTLRSAGVPAIFVESTAGTGTARQLADESGVAVISALYTGTLGPPGSGAATYIEYMQFNTTVIVKALGGQITPP